MAHTLAQLIDEITVDANGTEEQFSAFLQVFLDEVTTPIAASILGVVVDVIGFSLEGDERRGVVARCRRTASTETIALADLTFAPDSVAGWLHAAYRTWLCLRPFPATRPRHWAWPEQ